MLAPPGMKMSAAADGAPHASTIYIYTFTYPKAIWNMNGECVMVVVCASWNFSTFQSGFQVQPPVGFHSKFGFFFFWWPRCSVGGQCVELCAILTFWNVPEWSLSENFQILFFTREWRKGCKRITELQLPPPLINQPFFKGFSLKLIYFLFSLMLA